MPTLRARLEPDTLGEVKSRDLTIEQVDRMITVADRQFAYYRRMWQRCQDNGLPIDDPLATGVCNIGAALQAWRQTLLTIRREIPQHYRPLVTLETTSGLASGEIPSLPGWPERTVR